jgi:LPS export ABC transporter protein LptC
LHLSHIKNIRRLLIAVIVIVLLAVTFNYLYTWRKRANMVKQAARILSADMMRSVESIEYTESKNGVVRFKIRAHKLLETRLGKSLLEGIEAYDFNPDGSIRNEIHSQEAEYDKESKLADFMGNVRLFIGKALEIRTDSLHYDLSSNIGTTQDRLEFHSPQANGTARGIRYDRATETVALDNEVNFVLIQHRKKPDGSIEATDLRVVSRSAVFSQQTHKVDLHGNARLESASDLLSGDDVEAILSEDQKYLLSLVSAGNANYQSKSSSESRTMKGDRIIFNMSPSGGTVEKIDALGQASFDSLKQTTEEELRGEEIHIEMDPAKETPRSVMSRNGVSFRLTRNSEQTLITGGKLDAVFSPQTGALDNIQIRDKAKMSKEGSPDSDSSELHAEEIDIKFREINGAAGMENLSASKDVQWISRTQDKNRAIKARSLKASSLTMEYSEKGDYLESAHASGNVIMAEIPASESAREQSRRILADSVRFGFYPLQNHLKKMLAGGHVQVFSEKRSDSGKRGMLEEFRTASENMEASFSADANDTIDTASQWGKFVYKDRSRTATADRCDYDAQKNMLVLKGGPKISDEKSSTTGELMEYDQKNEVLSVHRKVRSNLKQGKEEQGSSFIMSSTSSFPTIVIADEMKYWTKAARASYSGNVQMLSENDQIEGQTLDIVDNGESIKARKNVLHVHALPAKDDSSKEQKNASLFKIASKTSANSKDNKVYIRSTNLEYTKSEDKIVYSGNATMRNGEVNLSSVSLDVILDSDGNIKRATAHEKVLIKHNDRICMGDTADYYLNPGKFVVRGNPAKINDPDKRQSKAGQLTWFTTDDRILIDNE